MCKLNKIRTTILPTMHLFQILQPLKPGLVKHGKTCQASTRLPHTRRTCPAQEQRSRWVLRYAMRQFRKRRKLELCQLCQSAMCHSCATAVALRVDCVAEMIPRTSELLQCPNSLLQLQVRSNFGTTHFKKNARPQCRCSSARHLLECVTAVENLDVVHALSMWCEYVKNSQFDTC